MCISALAEALAPHLVGELRSEVGAEGLESPTCWL
jgi:hypothetical protein